MTDKQAVVDETVASAEPDAPVTSARKDEDLESLLSQFDNETRKPDPQPTETKATPQVSEPVIPDRIKALEQRLLQEDVDKACGEIFEGMKIPRRAQVGWLDQVARENPAIAQAFLNKPNNPGAWNRFAKALIKEAKKDFAADIDEGVTADVNAVAAAVKGASTPATREPPPNFGRMSDAELAKFTSENYGF